ncbi:hypothetical protein RHMOL_Rhmol08G0229900 [Rhododendron molle]|uniref:Uncharacterized protein n=1 Tax=Rhododendron molle TaxID=49168 RepID=A0ACC0MRR8_RHOML|nr:hypothetical protein RHMOL_Rhmol08G0229900 [Rhododendron molle]
MDPDQIHLGGRDHADSESSHDEHGAATPSISPPQTGSVGVAASNTVASGSTSTAPVSSVASESAFSAGKRVLDEKRSRLAPDILDCLLCLKDWEDARLGIQTKSAKDELRDYFSDSDIDGDD